MISNNSQVSPEAKNYVKILTLLTENGGRLYNSSDQLSCPLQNPHYMGPGIWKLEHSEIMVSGHKEKDQFTRWERRGSSLLTLFPAAEVSHNLCLLKNHNITVIRTPQSWPDQEKKAALERDTTENPNKQSHTVQGLSIHNRWDGQVLSINHLGNMIQIPSPHSLDLYLVVVVLISPPLWEGINSTPQLCSYLASHS